MSVVNIIGFYKRDCENTAKRIGLSYKEWRPILCSEALRDMDKGFLYFYSDYLYEMYSCIPHKWVNLSDELELKRIREIIEKKEAKKFNYLLDTFIPTKKIIPS